MKKPQKKRTPNAEELRECAALNAIYKAKKKALGVTQEKIAIEGLKANSQSAASHYLTGRNPLNVEAASVFSQYLQVPVSDFSPRLAKQIKRLSASIPDYDAIADQVEKETGLKSLSFAEMQERNKAKDDQAVLDALNAMTEIQARLLAGKLTKAQVAMLRDLRAAVAASSSFRNAKADASSVVPIRPATEEETGTFNPDENVLVRQSTAKIAAGHGEQNTHVDIDRELAFKKAWIKRKGLNPAYLIVAYASGSSMSPRIEDGDAVLIDTSSQELKNGKIFAFKDGEREDIIKRAVKEKGVWLLRSDNPDKSVPEYQDMPFLDEHGQQRFEIVGLAHWRGGDL